MAQLTGCNAGLIEAKNTGISQHIGTILRMVFYLRGGRKPSKKPKKKTSAEVENQNHIVLGGAPPKTIHFRASIA